MEKDDKGSTLIRIGVSGWKFLLVPAYPGCPGSKAAKRSLLLLLFILSVWFLWSTAVKSIQLASVLNIFSCSVAVCSPTQILSYLSMRCRTLNGHNFFPQGGINGELSRFTTQRMPFPTIPNWLVTNFVRVQSKSGWLKRDWTHMCLQFFT